MDISVIENFKATYIDNDAVSNANLLGERFRTTYDKAARYDNVGNWFLAKKGSALSNAANGGVTWNHQVLLKLNFQIMSIFLTNLVWKNYLCILSVTSKPVITLSGLMVWPSHPSLTTSWEKISDLTSELFTKWVTVKNGLNLDLMVPPLSLTLISSTESTRSQSSSHNT